MTEVKSRMNTATMLSKWMSSDESMSSRQVDEDGGKTKNLWQNRTDETNIRKHQLNTYAVRSQSKNETLNRLSLEE